jgi:hypothetical protein
MRRSCGWFLIVILLCLLEVGCGGSAGKDTYKDKDKPKPAEKEK